MIDRRHFLQNSALISLAPWIPAFLPKSIRAADTNKDDRILIVIQLDGGNDGLNTVIPFADDNYAASRPTLKMNSNSVHKLNDAIGLHPSLKEIAELYQEGLLTIVQGVGYPNPNRSHFDSMSIWQRGSIETQPPFDDGWLGRAVDSVPKRDGSMADSVHVGESAIPLALRGRRANAISLERDADLTLLAPANSLQVSSSPNDLAQFVTRIQVRSFEAARQLEQTEKNSGAASNYPQTKFARHLQLIAKLIKLGVGTRAYCASQDGYDTHAQQLDSHRRLLTEFSGGLRSFVKDLKDSNLLDRVVVMVFSEFGRRVQENGSAGTDHGAAGPVLLAGSSLRRGLVGDHPSLTDLTEGDLKMSIDFRSIYASMLTNWLQIDAQPVLGTAPSSLELFID